VAETDPLELSPALRPAFVPRETPSERAAGSGELERPWMRVYISGPITGQPRDNRPAFSLAADLLAGAGFEFVNPHDLGASLRRLREMKGGKPPTWIDYMRVDLAALLGCQAILLLPGWERSRGATLEKHLADELAIPELRHADLSWTGYAEAGRIRSGA